MGERLRPPEMGKPYRKGTLTKLKESILMKNTPVEAGRFAAFSPLPMFFVTVLWCWFVLFGLYMGVFGMDVPIPNWVVILGVLPYVFSPLLGLLGIIHGILKRKEKRAWLGILLSALCLIENFLLFYGMGYIGSRY